MFNSLIRKFYIDNVELNLGSGGKTIATLDDGGVQHEQVINEFLVGGVPVMVDAANPLPVGGIALASIDLKTPSQGQAAMAASVPVVIASNQSAIPVTISSGAGDATAANQTLQITQETAFNTVMGLIADAVVSAGATGSISAKLRRATQGLEDLKSLIVLAAGTNLIGKVGIDQTTPGTTNGVQVNAALPAGANAIGKLAANSGVTIGAVEIAAAQTLATVTTVGAVTSITNNVNVVAVAPTTVLNGKTSVTTAGTRVVLAASTACQSVTIKALSTNTGIIYVGSSTVSSANGFQLAAGDSVSLDIANLTTVNIDSSVNGESVSYIANN